MIRVIRWRDFQHYHNRRVPWVKLYSWLLNDREYRALPKEARAILTDVWLLASETQDGVLNLSPEDIAWRLRDNPVEIRRLLAIIATDADRNGPKWLELSGESSKSLDGVCQPSMPEREKEREGEKGNPPRRPVATSIEPSRTPDSDVVAVLKVYAELHPARRPFDGAGIPKASAHKAVKKALNWGFTVEQLQAALRANAADAWHVEHKKHELEYVLRTEDKVCGWIERAEASDNDAGRDVYAGVTFVGGS